MAKMANRFLVDDVTTATNVMFIHIYSPYDAFDGVGFCYFTTQTHTCEGDITNSKCHRKFHYLYQASQLGG